MSDRLGTTDTRTPAHYRGEDGLQPWDVIDAFHLDFYLGTALAYICRYGLKANPEDLRKAHHCLEAYMQRLAGMPDPRDRAEGAGS